MVYSLLRNVIREGIVCEVTKLPKEYFSVINDAIAQSKFWSKPNFEEDIDYYKSSAGGTMSTPAAVALQKSLSGAMTSVGLDMDVLVRSHDTDSEDYKLHAEHPAWPNRWLIDAKWYVSKQKPGRNTIDLEIMVFSDEADPDAVKPSAVSNHIAHTVRHELVHYVQMKRQRLKKGLDNDAKAFEDMINDPEQIPNDDDPKYWEVYEPTGKIGSDGKEEIRKEGKKEKLYQQDYLRSHIEIDAHAHDAAEDLLAFYGAKGARELLSSPVDLSDPDLPNGIYHYYSILPKEDKTLKLLKSKIQKYLQYFESMQ